MQAILSLRAQEKEQFCLQRTPRSINEAIILEGIKRFARKSKTGWATTRQVVDLMNQSLPNVMRLLRGLEQDGRLESVWVCASSDLWDGYKSANTWADNWPRATYFWRLTK